MKKALLSSMLMFSVLANAQNKNLVITSPGKHVHSFKQTNISAYKASNSSFLQSKTLNQTGSAWFNKVDFIEYIVPQTQVFSAMHLFPDSTIILGYDSGNQPIYPWVHKAANYMDPSFMIQQNIITDKFATYTIDSVSVGYLYERNTGTSNNTADSLIIQIIAENHALDYTLTGPPGFPYQDITYTYTSNNLTGMTVLKRLSIPLTYADTCAGGLYKQIKAATPGIAAQTNSKKIGMVVSFKPGYTYTTTDLLIGDGTNIANKNVFFILSSEENGTNTDPTVFGVPNDYTSDMNMSYILDQSVRYNTNANGWNGYFLPTFAYTTPFRYEHHDLGYKLTVNITGIEEINQKGFALGQNAPNPFNGTSVVEYQLVKPASEASFKVSDVMGREISNEKVATEIGKHSIELKNYASGVYYYTLTVDGNAITKKMIVD